MEFATSFSKRTESGVAGKFLCPRGRRTLAYVGTPRRRAAIHTARMRFNMSILLICKPAARRFGNQASCDVPHVSCVHVQGAGARTWAQLTPAVLGSLRQQAQLIQGRLPA